MIYNIIRNAWLYVRTVAELTILTRASYFMLILVPVLAAIWPVVPTIVNDYQDDLARAAQDIGVHVDRYLDTAGVAPQDAQVKETLDRLSRDVAQIASAQEQKVLEASKLPPVWVWAYFSSLSAVLGQLIYQARAPQIVREHTIDEYRLKKQGEFQQHPEMSLLVAAATRHVTLSRREEAVLLAVIGEDLFRNRFAPYLSQEMESRAKFSTSDYAKELFFEGFLRPFDGDLSAGKVLEDAKLMLENAPSAETEERSLTSRLTKHFFEMEYEDLSRQSVRAGPVSLFLYSVAIVLLLNIIVEQSVAVLSAAGAEFTNWSEFWTGP